MSASATVTCQICDEEHSLLLACRHCKGEYCQQCFCTALLYSGLEPTCMHEMCRVPIPLQAIMLLTPNEWFECKYLDHRADLLMKQENNQMQETQAAYIAYQIASIIAHRPHFHNLSARLQENVTICLRQRGKGFEGFDFDNEDNQRPKGLTLSCPAPNCRGFISGTTCSLCGCEICDKCHEIVKPNNEHHCDPSTLLTIRAIFKEAKPCPKCAALISKIEGCDQMFCTQCHTTYSWLTGELLKGQVHNPHYFEWLFSRRREQAQVDRLVPLYQCDQYISYQNLTKCFRQQTVVEARLLRGKLPAVYDFMAPLPSHAHYYTAFNRLRDHILDVRATSGNHANVQQVDNQDLRVMLISNEITLEQMKEKVAKRDTDYHRFMAYNNVYMLVYESTIVIFDNIYAFTCERYKLSAELKRNYPHERFFYESYVQLQRLLEFANECLEFNDRVYGKDPRFVRYRRHPYS